MRLFKGTAALAALCGVFGTAHAEVFDLSIGDESFRAALYGPLARIAEGRQGQYDLGLLMRPEREDDLFMAHAGVLVTGDAGAQQFDLAAGLGVRGVYIGSDDESGGGLALGGQAEARFPGYERVGFSAYGHFAPEVLMLGEFEQYYEIGTAVDYQVLRDASVYVGYRNVNVELENGTDITADNGFHGGLRLSF